MHCYKNPMFFLFCMFFVSTAVEAQLILEKSKNTLVLEAPIEVLPASKVLIIINNDTSLKNLTGHKWTTSGGSIESTSELPPDKGMIWQAPEKKGKYKITLSYRRSSFPNKTIKVSTEVLVTDLAINNVWVYGSKEDERLTGFGIQGIEKKDERYYFSGKTTGKIAEKDSPALDGFLIKLKKKNIKNYGKAELFFEEIKNKLTKTVFDSFFFYDPFTIEWATQTGWIGLDNANKRFVDLAVKHEQIFTALTIKEDPAPTNLYNMAINYNTKGNIQVDLQLPYNINSVEVDQMGNLYTFGDLPYIENNQYKSKMVVEAYDNKGHNMETYELDTTTVNLGYPKDMSTGHSVGEVFLATNYVHTVSIIKLNLFSDFGEDPFEWKTELNCEFPWYEGYYLVVNAIASDAENNSYIVGTVQCNLLGNMTTERSDAFLAKYDPYGNMIWLKQFGTPLGFEYGTALVLEYTQSSDYNIYVAGYTNSGLDGYKNAGGNDIFVARYSSNGEKIALKQFGSNNDDIAVGIKLSGDEKRIYVAGYTDSKNFMGKKNHGKNDIFMVELSSLK